MKKQHMQLWIIALLVIAMLIPTATAGAVNATKIQLYSGTGDDAVNVTGTTYGFNPGEEVELTVVTTPEDIPEELTCTSTYPSIATCEISEGTITVKAVKNGTSTITVKGASSKKTAKLPVKVGNMASGIEITSPKDGDEITAGTSTLYLNWTVTYTDGNTAKNKNAVFFVYNEDSTTNKNVTVKSSGKVTANTAFTAKTPVTIKACSSDNARDYDNGGERVCDSITLTVIPSVKTLDICKDADGTDCPAQIALELGSADTASLVAVVTPDDAKKEVTWKSSNTNIAKVDTDGNVTPGTKAGTATITATAADGSRKSSTIKVNVGKLVQSITLTGADTMTSLKTTKITATVSPTDATNKKVNWKIIDPDCDKTDKSTCDASKYATVSAGTVRAKQVEKKTTITVLACPADGNTEACAKHDIEITPAVSKIRLLDADNNEVTSSKIYAIQKGDTYEFAAKVSPEDANQTVTWKSSSERIATVSDGIVTPGTNAGTVTITATAGGKSATARVRVVNELVSSVAIEWVSGVEASEGKVSLANGQSVKLKANVLTATADNRNVKWYIVDPSSCTSEGDYRTCAKSSYATVSGGKVTARKTAEPKDLYVIAEAADGSGEFDTYSITVIPVASKISISYIPDETSAEKTDVTNKTIKEIIDLNSGDSKTIRLYGTVTPDTANQELTWKSSNEKIAGVDADGLVTFYNSGTVTITATAKDGSKRSAKVTITGKIVVETITISGSTSVAAGKSIQLKAKVEPTNATNQKLTWKSSNSSIASVNSSGKVTGGKNVRVATPVTIYATATDVDERHQTPAQGYYDIVVYPAVTSVTILGEDSVSKNGKTIAMDLNVKPDYQLSSYTQPDGASPEVTWKSSKPGVATVDETGLVTAVANGTTVITCTAADGSGKKATVTIKVSTMVTKIEIANEEYEVREGNKIYLTAVLSPEKPSNGKLTWVSEDTSVVKVSGTGTTGTVIGQKVTTESVVCTNVYAKATDGSEVESNKLEICVYPYARSVKVLDKDDADITGQTISLPEGEVLEIHGQAYPGGAKQKFTIESNDSKNGVKVTYIDEENGSSAYLTSITKGKTVTITVKTTDGSGTKGTIKIKTTAAIAKNLEFTGMSVTSLGASPMAVSDEAGMSALSVASLDDTASEVVLGENTLTAGSVAQLSYEISPAAAAENEVAYFSSDDSLATVDENGVVTVANEIAEDTTVTITALVMDGSATSGTMDIALLGNAVAEVVDEEAVTEEPTGEATATEEATVDPEATATEEATVDPEATATEEATVDPEATATEEATVDPEATATEEATVDPEATATEEATVEQPTETPAPEVPAVTEIKLDVENDTVSMFAGENVTVESWKLTILPENADVSAIEFKIENEAVAKLRSDKIEDIMANGLIIDSVAAGETKLTIKSGDVEKVIKIVVNAVPTATPEPTIDVAATEQAIAAEQAAAEAAAQAAAEAEAAAAAAAEAEAANSEVTVVENTGDPALN